VAEIKSMVRLMQHEEGLGWAKNPPAVSSEQRIIQQSRWSARHRAWLVMAPAGRSLPLAAQDASAATQARPPASAGDEPERSDHKTVPMGPWRERCRVAVT
jgi:hypothetical protein